MTEAPQNEAAQLVIGMVIVGLIVFGIVGSFILKWIEDRAVDDLSTIPPFRAPEITSSAPVDELARNSTHFLVPPDTYQSEPRGIEVDNTDTVLADEAALARHLAGLRQPNGLHWLSANKIVSLVKLSRNDVLAAVRSVRIDETEEPEQVDPSKMLRVRDDRGERLIPR